VNNASKLREYKRVYGLNTEKVADILGCSIIAVNGWLLRPDSPFYHPMPNHRLDYLKLRLRGRKKV